VDERRILLCFAHPDDETFLAGGSIGKWTAEGVGVALVTATRGQSGRSGDPPVCTREDLPAVREAELREAAAILGIADVHLLDYRDRELAAAQPMEIRQSLVHLIRGWRPQVVVTFDPNGSNRHTDHVAISRFTSDAVAAASDRRWFPDEGDPHLVSRLVWTPPAPTWELARALDLTGRPGVDFLIDTSRWAARKRQALQAHRTQHLSIARVFLRHPDADRLLGVEVFRQAWGPVLARRPIDDVFAGL
jgi:LmbE family N-acetylglucosaminyl deacetylase